MPANGTELTWDIEDVLGTSRGSTGVPMLQIGDVKTGTVVSNNTTLWGVAGMLHFPAPPSAGVSAPQAIVLKTSSGDIAIAMRDTANAKLSGQMKMGETAVFATVGMARALFKANGEIVLFTTDDNTSSGQSIFLSVGPEGVKIGTPWGALTLTKDGVQLVSSGGSWCLLGSNGSATLGGSSVAIAGGSVSLGISASPSSPILWGLSGPGAIPSTSVFVSV